MKHTSLLPRTKAERFSVFQNDLLFKSNSVSKRPNRAFTLVELLVVLAIIGILVGLLIPAVQSVRETARKVTCQNNLSNLGVALHNYHSGFKKFPPGSFEDGSHSWCTEILPFMEYNNVYMGIDYNVPWDAPFNLPSTETNIPSFICPTTSLRFDGKTDYGGITGSILSGLPAGEGSHEAFGSGVLIRLNEKQRRPVRIILIVDGTSNTMMVGEAADRPRDAAGSWANGNNIFSHDNGPINSRRSTGELQSWHNVGANALFADGSVHLLDHTIDLYVIGAISTRNGFENFDRTW